MNMLDSESPIDAAKTLSRRLAACLEHIALCEARYGRVAGSARLVAVSKRHSAATIAAACAAGQRDFGENYLAEARAKQLELADLALVWHFIGAIQSNKTREIAENFDWVHTVDRIKIAERLDRQRPEELPPLKVLIQVNISAEVSKNGISSEELPSLVTAVEALPRLALCGLMALPASQSDFNQQRQAFAALRELGRQLGASATELSMGTTNDYEAAIAEGATLLRLGTAIFGPRPDRA